MGSHVPAPWSETVWRGADARESLRGHFRCVVRSRGRRTRRSRPVWRWRFPPEECVVAAAPAPKATKRELL